MESLTINYKLNKKEISSYFRWNFFRHLFSLVSLFQITAVILIFTSYLLFIKVNEVNIYITLFVVLAITAIIKVSYSYFMLMDYVDVYIKKTNSLNAETKREITMIGVTREFGNSNITETWADMNKYHETRHLFIVEPTKVELFILPKSALINQEELVFIRDCLKNIPNNKAKDGDQPE